MSQVIVNLINTPVGTGVQSKTGAWMVAGQTERGRTDQAIACRNLAEVVKYTGQRVAYGFIYDCAEFFFKLGGSVLYIGRVVGPAAVSATHTFIDSSASPALTVKANSPGQWGNNLTVAISAGGGGGTFVLTIAYNGKTVEVSPDLADAAAAIAWANQYSQYAKVTDPGATADPATIAATALTTGTDDRTSVTNTQWATAINLLGKHLGCGQESAPGIGTSAIQQLIADHAETTNRDAIIDLTDLASSSSVAATVTSITGTGRRRVNTYAPWAVVAGLTPSASPRTIPWSAIQAGMTARSDGDGSTPNVDNAVAGDNGIADVVLGLSQPQWTQTDRDLLAAAGVNPIRVDGSGRAQTDGNSTLADPTTDPAWVEVSAMRTLMYVADGCAKIAFSYRYKTLDPKRVTIGRYGSDLQAFLTGLANLGQLSNDPASAVDVGLQVNTATTISAKQLLANVAAQPSGSAETVILNIYAEAS